MPTDKSSNQIKFEKAFELFAILCTTNGFIKSEDLIEKHSMYSETSTGDKKSVQRTVKFINSILNKNIIESKKGKGVKVNQDSIQSPDLYQSSKKITHLGNKLYKVMKLKYWLSERITNKTITRSL